MVEILQNIFIGNQDDYEQNVRFQKNWAVVHACKEPYHRQALGYSGRGADKNHPEYLIAVRGDRLILNLVDVDNPEWVSPIIIDKAMEFINEKSGEGKSVLIHCNQGMSRSAVIGLLYLATKDKCSNMDFNTAEIQYMDIYPHYNPAKGMRDYATLNWEKYCK